MTAPLDPDALRALVRLGSREGCQVVLDVPHEPVRQRSGSSTTWVLILSRATMSTVVRLKRSDDDHINLGEARAVLLALQREVRMNKFRGHRLIFIVDSKVVKGAVRKGRSPSWKLNRVLQQLLTACILGEVWVELLFTPSEFNVADMPSRDLEVFSDLPCRLSGDFAAHLGCIKDLGTSRARGAPLARLRPRQRPLPPFAV